MSPVIAIAYLRVSRDDQLLGLDAQRALIETWAARQGVRLAAWHVDRGVSGGISLERRPALLEALGAIRAARASVLVVAKRDRIARDVLIAMLIERAARREGAQLISADGTANGESPADAFMRTIIDAAAAYERAIIGARTRAALAVKRARGERTGQIPFGWRAAGAVLEHSPEEQQIIARVVSLRSRGVRISQIVRVLEAEGRRSRTGLPLARTQVVNIVRGRET